MRIKLSPVLVLLFSLASPFAFAAEEYPSRPIRLVAPFPPGGEGLTVTGGPPGEFQKLLARDIGKWRRVAKEAHIRAGG